MHEKIEIKGFRPDITSVDLIIGKAETQNVDKLAVVAANERTALTDRLSLPALKWMEVHIDSLVAKRGYFLLGSPITISEEKLADILVAIWKLYFSNEKRQKIENDILSKESPAEEYTSVYAAQLVQICRQILFQIQRESVDKQ